MKRLLRILGPIAVLALAGVLAYWYTSTMPARRWKATRESRRQTLIVRSLPELQDYLVGQVGDSLISTQYLFVSEVGNDAFSSGSLIRNEKRIGGWSCTYYFKRWDDEPASARLWIELFDRAEEKSTPAFKAFVQRVRRDSYAEHRFEGVDFTGSLLPGGTIGISMSMAWPNPWVDEGPPYSTSANSFRLRSLPRILAFLRREILSDSAIVGLHVEGAEPVEEMGEEAPNLISGDVRTGPTLIPIEFRTDRVNGGIGPYVEVKIGRSKQGDHSSSQSWEKAFQGVLKPYVLNMAKSDPYDPGRMGTWYEGELGMDAPEEDGHHTVLTVRFPLDFDLEHASLRSLKKIR